MTETEKLERLEALYQRHDAARERLEKRQRAEAQELICALGLASHAEPMLKRMRA